MSNLQIKQTELILKEDNFNKELDKNLNEMNNKVNQIIDYKFPKLKTSLQESSKYV